MGTYKGMCISDTSNFAIGRFGIGVALLISLEGLPYAESRPVVCSVSFRIRLYFPKVVYRR